MNINKSDFSSMNVDAALEENRMTRRASMSRVAAMLSAAGLGMHGGLAFAQGSREIVFANWGGQAVQVFSGAYRQSLTDQGIKLSIDGSGPSAGKIRNMVEARHVVWDICDSGIGTTMELGNMGLLEPIDYGVVDKSKILPGYALKYGVAGYTFSSVLAYDTTRLRTAPRSWADFWDVEKFPGKRLLNRNVQGVLEAALMADGVEPSRLYPIDVERALRKIRQLKPHLLYWATAADSQRMLRDGEVTMAMIWSTRATQLATESKGRIAWTFNQGLLQPGMYVVPRGSPNARTAMQALAIMQQPASQLEIYRAMGYGPGNPAAASLLSGPEQQSNPTSAANLAMQVALDPAWYGENQSKALQAYLEAISA
jgi:putative spermidine/putrescine transport system substrate-binding protein